MFKNPYLTLTGRNYVLNKINVEIETSFIKNELVRLPNTSAIIYMVTGKNNNIPNFTHMVTVELSTDDRVINVIDGRQFVKNSDNEYGFIVTATNDYGFARIRASLEVNLSEESDYRDLYTSGDLPMFVYTQWFAESITRRLGLEPEAQLNISIIAAAHYISMHTENGIWSDNDRARYTTKIANATSIPAARILETLMNLDYISNLEEFVSYCHEEIDSSRIKPLNVGLIIQILASGAGWRGANSKEIIAVALEHAPTWHAVVYSAIDERTYAKSKITEYVKRFRNKDTIRNYVLSLKNIMGE